MHQEQGKFLSLTYLALAINPFLIPLKSLVVFLKVDLFFKHHWYNSSLVVCLCVARQ